MKSDKKSSTNKCTVFTSNMYAVKNVWQISQKRVIHTALYSLTGYAEWIFMSIFYLRHVINAIETKQPFETILLYIGICFAVFCLLSVYTSYMNSVIIPYTDNKIYCNLYKRLYAKARNVELRCFEDPDFYNKYTMALDGAPQKMTTAVTCFFQVIFGIIASIAAFYSMFMIDPFSVFF